VSQIFSLLLLDVEKLSLRDLGVHEQQALTGYNLMELFPASAIFDEQFVQ
jgi:hypothetical protein